MIDVDPPPTSASRALTPRHLLALDGLPRSIIETLLDRADSFVPAVRGDAPLPAQSLRGRIIASLFLEDSTRTRASFAVAIRRLGGEVVELAGRGSSMSKGESLRDTVRNIEAMGVDAIVIRCTASGGPARVADGASRPIINAGDGRHEHPTQGLLDLLTLRRRLGSLEDCRVAIVGDIAASRVARSALHGLLTLGARVDLVGPPTLVPGGLAGLGTGSVAIHHELDSILGEIDAIIMLRVQFERGSDVSPDYHTIYGLTRARADRLKPGAPVLHPGPINRGLELDVAVADDPRRSVILDQVTNGVAVRMAVLDWALGS